MAIDSNEKALKDFDKEPDGVDRLLEEHHISRENADFQKKKPALFRWAVILCIAVIALIFYFSSDSKVKSISVTGNYYLDRNYITSLSGLSLNDRYLLVNPWSAAKKIEKDGMIDQCHVRMLKDNVIQIEVTEKKAVGYRSADDGFEILMSDGSSAELKSDYLSIIAKIPMIRGFDTEQQTYLLTKAFSDVDQTIIENISEVTQYTLNYDDEALDVLMRDGTHFIASYYSLNLINSYNQIYEKMEDRTQCIFADEGLKVAYTKACPWNDTEVSHDYWTKSDGSYVLNKYGDKVVKHYYTDAEGNQYLDNSGNPILIPIDSSGSEINDDSFTEHYDAGYYATGTLVLPDQTSDTDASPTPDA